MSSLPNPSFFLSPSSFPTYRTHPTPVLNMAYQKIRAVLVGISYKFRTSEDWPPLEGTITDVEALRDTLIGERDPPSAIPDDSDNILILGKAPSNSRQKRF